MVILKDVRDAIALHSQIPVGKHWSIRSVETPVSTSKTTTYAQRDKPRALMTRDPRNGLGQDPSSFHLHWELILCHIKTNAQTMGKMSVFLYNILTGYLIHTQRPEGRLQP